MNSRKGQNSILFLTTLGVYLGLVLVGATPQALAHQRAAMTRQFDIRDEIEFRDDLDRDPDDERSPIGDSVEVYLQDLEQLITALGGLDRNDKFDRASSHFEVSQTVLLPCMAFNQAGNYTPDKFQYKNASLRPALERFSKQLVYGYSLGDCVKSNSFAGKEAVTSRSAFKFDGSALSVEIKVRKSSPGSAKDLLGALPGAFRSDRILRGASALRRKLVDATSFRKDNDQVFIVTRLPRASIDELLADNAK